MSDFGCVTKAIPHGIECSNFREMEDQLTEVLKFSEEVMTSVTSRVNFLVGQGDPVQESLNKILSESYINSMREKICRI